MNNGVAIIIPTKNRSEFLIRQLRYYSSVNCKYSIYICDDSDSNESQKIMNELTLLKNLNIIYLRGGGTRNTDAIMNLLTSAEEQYFTLIGDDDYLVPSSLRQCANFLDSNSDYSSASGHAVSFRLKEGTVIQGILKRLADYPRGQFEQDTAKDRLTNFMSQFSNCMHSVTRVSTIKPYSSIIRKVKNNAIASEWLPNALIVIAGKTKLLNNLSLVRQLHNDQIITTNLFDQVITSEWRSSQKLAIDLMSERLVEVDNIFQEEANSIAKNAFENCLLLSLKQVKKEKPKIRKSSFIKLFKRKIAIMFPWIKSVYYSVKVRSVNIHYQVLEPRSVYYKDFLPIYKSFTR